MLIYQVCDNERSVEKIHQHAKDKSMRQEFQSYEKNHLVIGILQKLPTELLKYLLLCEKKL